ncbi:MAG: ArdC family protein [Solirubrobacterales bacterium]
MAVKKRLTDAERDQRRAQDRERLKAATEQLLSSEGWRRWVRVRSRNGLARYSISNQLLIAMACPEATFVAGFRAWLDLGFAVQKGQRAIRIMAPMPVRERDPETDEKSDETCVLFKAVSVFDRRQVAPIEGVEQAPLEPPCEPLSGDSHAHLIDPMVAFAGSLGYSVSFEAIPGSAGGHCDAEARRIVVDAGQPANARLRILIHECAHALGIDYRSYSRAQAEVMVETATLLAASTVGLAVGGESVPYVAGWGEDGALEAVTEFAATIDGVARRIEDALSVGREQPTPRAA